MRREEFQSTYLDQGGHITWRIFYTFLENITKKSQNKNKSCCGHQSAYEKKMLGYRNGLEEGKPL